MFGSSVSIKIPPVELIRYTCGMDSASNYIRSGLEVSTMLTLAATRFGGRLADLGPVLDFGCGAGRILGAMEFGGAEVSGCDVNSSELDSLRKHIPVSKFCRHRLCRHYLLKKITLD